MKRTKALRLAFYAIALALLTNKNLLAQLLEEVDPTVSQFEVIRGSGDPDHTGALNFRIPLMKIPGRSGLDYDLELVYVNGNGVAASEAASWVGLGWNLNLYQISCSPAYGADQSSAQKEVTSTGKDLYHLSYPGGSTPIYQFDDGWRPLDWKAIKIEATEVLSENSGGWYVHKDYGKFTITDLDGTRYIFAQRLRQESSTSLTNHCLHSQYGSHANNEHPYYYVFKLSAILGTNYVDGNGDDIPGNGGTDKGSWIKLEYSTITVVDSGTPYYYRMEVNDLAKIKTPTHEAVFNFSTGNRYYIYQGKQSSQLGTLNYVQLNPAGTKIEFFTSRKWAWAKFNGANYSLVKTDGSNGDFLRGCLDSLRIGSGGQYHPSYKFEYTGNPQEGQGASCGLDPWGYYTTNPFVPNPQPTDFKWNVWLLNKVTYPTGGTAEFEYESNRYQTYIHNFRSPAGDGEILSGGVRLKKQTLTDPHTETASVYTYEYALTNQQHPSHGFLSCEPMFFEMFNLTTQSSVGKNLRTEVHYPDVQITRPDGSRIRKYYTSAFSSVQADPPSDLYNDYSNSYSTITIDSDPDLQAIVICLGCQNGLWDYFNPSGSSYPLGGHQHFLGGTYQDDKAAFLGEASEFDDFSTYIFLCTNKVNVQMFNNSWKRGHLTREELYLATADDPTVFKRPVQRKIYHYKMTPKKSQMYKVEAWANASACPPNGWYNSFPAFVTSGWVQLTKIETEIRYDLNSEYLSQFKIEEFAYHNTNGLVSKETVTRFGASAPKRITSYSYAFENNSSMDALHMWSQKALTVGGDQNSVFSSTLTSNLDIAALTQTAWYNDNGRWLPDYSLQWKDADNDKDFDAGETITEQDFFDYDNNHSNLLEVRDAKGTSTAIMWGHIESLPIAQGVNGRPEEFGFSSFENASSNGWGFENLITYQEAHTGQYSMAVTSTSGSPLRSFYQTNGLNADVGFKASVWVKGPNTARLVIRIDNGSPNPVNDVAYASGTLDRGGEYIWELLEVELTKAQVQANMNGDDRITVFIANSGSTVAYFDDLRFYPADGLLTTRTYDQYTWQVTSIAEANNMPRFFKYDPLDRLIEQWDVDGNLVQKYDYHYSRQSNGDNYAASDPNSVKATAMATQGFWEDFPYQDSPILHGWTVYMGSGTMSTVYDNILQSQVLRTTASGTPTDFGIKYPASGTLDTFNPYLSVKIKDSDNFYFYVRVRATNQTEYDLRYEPNAGTPTINGSEIYYYLGTEYRSGVWKTIERDLRKDFAITGLQFESVRWFSIRGTYDLDDLRLNDQSILTMSYFDGFSRKVQSQTWFGDKDIVAHTVYDNVGMVKEQYLPKQLPDAYHRYYASFTPFTEYESFEYYHDPLTRLKRQTHDDGTQINYAYGVANNVLGADQRYEQITDENGYISMQIYDYLGNRIVGISADGTTDRIEWQQQYDLMGNLTINKPPNYFDPPSGTVAGDWDLENKYNTLSQLFEKQTPDDGTTKYLYDINGNLRYSQSAFQNTNGYNFTVYKYDLLNRVTLIGEEKIDDWNTTAPSETGDYGTGIDEWRTKYTYDVNMVAGAQNFCQGKLTQTEINDDGDDVAEHTYKYVHDKFGNVIEKRIAIDGGSPLTEKIVHYTYDRLGRLAEILYPSGSKVIRFYDNAGRLRKIYHF